MIAKFKTIISLFLVLISAEGYCLTLNFPEQKMTLALPIVNYNKVTYVTDDSQLLPMGFAAEYSMFLNSDLSIDAQFEVNLESSEGSIVFLGGSGGIKWYLIGGANEKYTDPYIRNIGSPDLNVYFSGGFAARQFDFRVIDSLSAEVGTAVIRDEKNVSTGNVFAMQFGMGVEYPVFSDLLPGARLQVLKSFSGQTIPDIFILEFWITTAFVL